MYRMAGALLASVLMQGGAQADERLRVMNWKNYIDPQVLEQFQHDSGIEVDYRTFTAAEELDQALAAGERFDLVVPSHFQLKSMIGRGQLAELDRSRLEHYASIDPGLLAMLAGLGGANRYAVPYLWGAVGLMVNPGLAEAAYGGPLPNSWSLLFDERQAARLAGCGLGLLDAPEETASLWFSYRGRSVTTPSTRQLSRHLQPLRSLAPQLRHFDNEAYIKALAAGQLCVAMAWNGHALNAVQHNAALQYLIPEEGASVFIDSLAIPTNAARPDLAYRLIGHLLQPDNALRTARVTQFYSPLERSSAQQQQLAREQPMQVPDAASRRRMYLLEPLPAAQKQVLDQLWGELKAARTAAH